MNSGQLPLLQVNLRYRGPKICKEINEREKAINQTLLFKIPQLRPSHYIDYHLMHLTRHFEKIKEDYPFRQRAILEKPVSLSQEDNPYKIDFPFKQVTVLDKAGEKSI